MGAISLSSTMAAAILLFLLAAAPRHAAAGTEYAVGDAAGWTNGPNYLAWSQKYNFTAGDTLVFNYVEGQHDVYQVTEDAFRTCEPANKTKRVWVSGRDYVNLTLPGDYYYICNVEGHCLGGMKLAVSVAAAPPPPPPPPSPPMFLVPPPPPPTGSAGRRLAWPEVNGRKTANQTIRLWDSGRDLVNLTAPGDYYFICNIAGHCHGSMKLAVAVAPPLPTTTLPSQPPPLAPPSAQPRPPSPPTLLPAVPPPPPSPPILPAQPPVVASTPSLPTMPTTPSTSGVSSTRRWLEVVVWIPCLTVISLLILLT